MNPLEQAQASAGTASSALDRVLAFRDSAREIATSFADRPQEVRRHLNSAYVNASVSVKESSEAAKSAAVAAAMALNAQITARDVLAIAAAEALASGDEVARARYFDALVAAQNAESDAEQAAILAKAALEASNLASQAAQ